MRSIKPRGNKSTELRLVVALREAGIRGWRRHGRLPGRPDFAFFAQRVAVFVDGDYWHGNPRSFKVPKTNSAFWRKKIRHNRAKDRRVGRALRARGWTVIRIWESALRKRKDWCVARVARAIK